MLDEYDAIPDGFLDAKVDEVATLCPKPTLIHLPGRRSPLFVSILLHGNEDAGLLAMQDFLKRYSGESLPRGLSLFVGNVQACAAGTRYLPHQVDFNRAWPGSDLPDSSTHALLADVTRRVVERGLFASVDIHNNTGRNPHYGCICSCAPEHVYLASLFSQKIVYFTRPKGVQTQAFMRYCPSLTCECGQIGDTAGAKVAADLLDTCMRLETLRPPEKLVPRVQIYHTVARIKIRDECSFGFEPGTDVVLRKDLDSLNFVELDAGEQLGTLSARLEDCFVVNDEHGRDVTDQYLSRSSRQVVLGRPAMPSMLTQNVDVIRQDCLGYLMEKLPTH